MNFPHIINQSNVFSYGMLCVCVIIIIIFNPIYMCRSIICICLCVCVYTNRHSFHFRRFSTLPMHVCVFIWIKWRHINCINELTNSDVFHVFYYFPFGMYYVGWKREMLMMWRIVEIFPPDMYLYWCGVYGVFMKALSKIPSAVWQKNQTKAQYN